MKPTEKNEVPGLQRELLTNLRIADHETNGHPLLAPDQVEPARNWLSRILVDARALRGHINLLQDLYQAKFRFRPARRDWMAGEPAPRVEGSGAFRYRQLLSEEKVLAIARDGLEAKDNQGIDVLTNREVAELL